MDVEKVDQILKRTLENLELEKRIKEGKLLQDWKDLVGSQIARHTQPLGIKKKKLFVRVDHSTWLYELSLYHKTELLNKLNEVAGERLIEDIYFKIGELDK